MTPADREAFVEIVLGFAELKGRQLSAPALELYWRSLQHWPLPAFRTAAEQLVRTCEFMPGPKDFEDLRKAGRATAGEAWAEVLAHVRANAYRGRVVVVSELVDRAVAAIGGYHAIGMCDSDKTHFLEKRFNEAFEDLQNAEDVREAVPAIAYSGSSRPRLNGPTKAGELLAKIGHDA
jgi:hypothetical protein